MSSKITCPGCSATLAIKPEWLEQQAAHFLDGRSSPDFRPRDFEVDFRGRATADDLTELGRAQMAL